MNTATTTEAKPMLPALVSGGAIRPIIPATFEEAWRIALAISKAGMSPPGLESPEKITIALMAGLETGLPPMQAIQSIAVINNRPSLYGDGPIALVRASGLLESIEEKLNGEGDAMTATCSVKRRGEPGKIIRQFSVADAKKAGLWTRKGPWEHYPTRMLAVRARAFALRDGFADVLRGLAIAEEQADIIKATAPQPGPPPDDAIPDFGDSVVEQEHLGTVSLDQPPSQSSEGSGEQALSHTPPTSESAAATQFRKSVELGEMEKLKAEAIGKILALASDPNVVEEQERLENLDQMHPVWKDLLDANFHHELFVTATKVAKGALKADAAKRYLERL